MKAQTILRNGGTIEIEGLHFVMDGDGEVGPGDVYIAERNVGPQLLTCAEIVHYEAKLLGGVWHAPWVRPQGMGYCYDVNECVKVRMVED